MANLGAIARFSALASVLSGSVGATSLPAFFEQSDWGYVGRASSQVLKISSSAVRFAPESGRPLILQWQNARGLPVTAEDPTGGVSHHFGGNESQWRMAFHYSRLRVRGLYANTDIEYYFRDGRFEFDVTLHQGSDPGRLRFELLGGARPSLDGTRGISVEAAGQRYVFRSPHAYQVRDGTARSIDCTYTLDKRDGIGFHLGAYDRSRELIIDPVVEFFTYLGGSGFDLIQATVPDASGNVIVAGITSSANFPGGGPQAGATSVFITKLNAAGTALQFTTLLGSYSYSNVNVYVPALESVTGLAVDSDGSIYVTGTTAAPNFPTTSGSWQQGSSGGFITKLDSGGNIVYSTFLGLPVWGLVAQRLRVMNGIAYLAGVVRAAEFLGTPGALQRGIAGGADFFVVALAADGSGPIFATAFGGSGQEYLSDMTLDAAGNIVLAGTSGSPDLPLTADALPYQTPANGGAMLARIDPSGSRLVSSTWLGTSAIGAVTALPDGSLVIGGNSSLPPDYVAAAPVYSFNFKGNQQRAYVAKLQPSSNLPVWTAALSAGESFLGGISADGQGNLYWPGFPDSASGGALGFFNSQGVTKLSADGSRLLYASSLPFYTAGITAVAGSAGSVFIAGYTSSSALPTTPGVVQPQRDPAPAGPGQNQGNVDDGFLGVLDLSSFVNGNFFAVPPSSATTLTWRIGEPAPKAIVQPIQWSGDAAALIVTPSSRLTAGYSSSPSPAVSVNVDTTQSIPGTFQESVMLQSLANTNAVLIVPVMITIQPQVSFDVASTQVSIRRRQGQQISATKVGITPNFGTEYFSFQVSSSANWMSGYVDQSDPQHPMLSINTSDQPPGTYDGTLTLSLQNLQNATRQIAVHYVVDPPATIQLSTTTISLHVVKGQPVRPAVVAVTGSVPGVQWSVFGGSTWLQVTTTTTTTPGEIHVTVDPATAEVGYWFFNLIVDGEANQTVVAHIYVDVSSGAPLDVVPASITYQYIRGGMYQLQTQLVSIVTRSPATVQLSADQPWIFPRSGPVDTPTWLGVVLDATIPEGVYHGKITLTAGSTSVVVPVTWMLYDAPHLVFSMDPIAFQWRIGDPLPAAQHLQITCPSLLQEAYSAGSTGIPNFLKIDPSYGSTPATLNLTIDPTGLGPGTYKTNLSIGGSYPDSTIYYPPIPVTLTVLPNPNAPASTITRVADAASYLGGAVSPGEAVVLFGSGLGPATLTPAQPPSGGKFPLSLAGWTFYFDEIPAPVIYASDKQTVVMAPIGIAGRTTTNVTVGGSGPKSAVFAVPVLATNPAVFTADSSGSGLAAALNAASDGSGSQNTAATPAVRGGVVTFFATGLGLTGPVMPDGSLATVPLPQLSAPVQVQVGGTAADVLYVGPAPGQIAGLMQINIRIPQNISTGLEPLLVIAGGNPSQPGVTLAVQ
jgi:uncharacterized protein (TIGR03437 family)